MDLNNVDKNMSLARLSACAGLILCLIMAFSKTPDSLCLTNGCKLFNDFAVFGIPAWIWGSIAFAILLGAEQARMFAVVFTAADCLFLLLMLAGSPCLNCMLAGLAFCMCLFFLSADRRKKHEKIIMACWCVLFLINFGSALTDRGMVDISKGKGRDVSIWFSPECAQCIEALRKYGDGAKLYPVMEKKEDAYVIIAMMDGMDKGAKPAEALEQARRMERRRSGLGEFLLDMVLWKNKGHVLNNGGVLPLIVLHGMPSDGDGIRNYLDNLPIKGFGETN